MSTPDDLALFAYECRRMAAESRNPGERLDWLRLAETWDRMREREQAGVGHGAVENRALARPAFALWA